MTNISELIAKIRDSQPREHTPLCYTPDVCQCGANVYNALRNHALALCEAVERLSAGDFTPEEFQNLCHKFSPEDRTAFCNGCAEYQRKLFGTSTQDELAAERLAKEAVEKARDGLKLKAADRDEWQDVAMKVSAERDALLKELAEWKHCADQRR